MVPGQRISQIGYSLVPPNEDGWEISQRDRLLVALAKRGANRNEVTIIWGGLFKLPAFQSDEEFVALVKQGKAADIDAKRFRVVKHEVTSHPGKGTNCAYSHEVLEDSQALTESGNRVDMVREMFSLTCAHPKNKNVAVNVTYSHRYYTGQRDPQLVGRARGVLDSVALFDF